MVLNVSDVKTHNFVPGLAATGSQAENFYCVRYFIDDGQVQYNYHHYDHQYLTTEMCLTADEIGRAHV